MERVLPWPGPNGSGWANLHWTKKIDGHAKPQWRGAPFKSVEPFLNLAQKFTVAPSKAQDIYFCLSVQAQAATHAKGFQIAMRDAKHAQLLKAIWLDVDVKDPPKGYADLPEAKRAVVKFCTEAGLPLPSALVESGGGLHVYWFSDRALTVAEWAPFAQGLRMEAERLGVRCDYGVTTDAARVLRVPGTFNRKLDNNPRAVRVSALGQDYDFARDLQRLHDLGAAHVVTATVTAKPALTIPDFDLAAFKRPDAEVLAALQPEFEAGGGRITGLEHKYSDLPLDPTLVIKECPHYRHSFLTGGAHDSQPLWNLTVLGATWFENGRGFAHGLSNKYPAYTEEETDALFDRKMGERASKGLGWPSCKSFEDNGCKLCKTCVYRGKINSPLNLAARVEVPPEPVALVDPLTAVEITPELLLLPAGFFLTDDKRIACKAKARDDEEPETRYVFHGQVVSRPFISGGATNTLNFRYREGPNYMAVRIPLAEITTEAPLLKCLSTQAVMVDDDRIVRKFMRSWVSKINHAYRMAHVHPFGWIMDGNTIHGFAYGGKLFRPDGTTDDTSAPHRALADNYTPCGEAGPLFQALEILSAQNHPALEVLALQAWCSPLLKFNGLYATVTWAYSKAAGAFKSSAIKTGMALWCSPGRAKDKVTATVSGMETKLDNLRNLPVFLDEITDERVLESMMHIVQVVPEGGQGPKSTRGGETRDPKSWRCVMVCGSNTSMHDYQAKRKATSDARPQRVFEVIVDKRPGTANGTEVEKLITSLDDNFGHIGLKYAQYLAMNVAKLDARYQEIDKQMEALLDPHEEERFWRGTINQTLLAAELANDLLGKPYFHVEAIRVFLIDAFRDNRRWVMENVPVEGKKDDTEIVMAQVFERFMNNLVVTDRVVKGKGDKSKVAVLRLPKENSGRGNPVYVQIIVNPALIRIDLRALRDYLVDELERSVSLVGHIEKFYGGVKRRGINMLANCDVPIIKPRVDVLEIAIPNDDHPLYPSWHAQAYSNQNMGLPAAPATEASAAAVAQDAAR
jgi:hypothetical protein